MRSKKVPIIGFTIAVIFLLAPICSAEPDKKADIETLRSTGEVFADIAAKVSPAVVFVSVEQEYTQKIPDMRYFDPFEQFQNDEFFQRFFGPQFRQRQQQQQQPRERKQIRRGQGSGFIVSADGYILTNNHVVRDASKITVKMSDDKELQARIIGTDPATDIAVIKVDANDLPAVELGDSDTLKVGQWVLAIGNPFGLSHTVTAGIVSAKGRSGLMFVDAELEYQDFIQTDAAINFGNSGGPLINIDGKVVGINSAIYSQSGGYIGIGFAIPVNMAKYIYGQLLAEGKVTRGYIGVYGEDVSDEMAEMLSAKGHKGVVVNNIVEGSPAEKAQLQTGDIIIKKDGGKIENWDSFRNEVARIPPGEKIKLTVVRDGKEKDVEIELAAREPTTASADVKDESAQKLGITVQNLTPEIAKQFGYKDDKTGVIVTDVEADSPLADAGIVSGTLIMEVNRQKVKDADEFWNLIQKAGNSILLYVRQGEYARYIAVKLAQ
ncbi:MAG: serine protease [Planctomycetes bacterium HGW-Planctomycetes-1]|nr:MAG: serine protease [Planctomycetes bacterium HGW-Planctomycetes-1]